MAGLWIYLCVWLFRYLFWSVMNTAITNAYILFMVWFKPLTLARSKMTHLWFRLELCDQLTAGYSSHQRARKSGLHQQSSKVSFLPMTLFISIGGRCMQLLPVKETHTIWLWYWNTFSVPYLFCTCVPVLYAWWSSTTATRFLLMWMSE